MSAVPKVLTAVASPEAISRAVKDDIETLLDAYKLAVDRRVCREIDAGACQTSADYRRAHEAQEHEENVRDQVIAGLIGLIHRSITHHNLGIIR